MIGAAPGMITLGLAAAAALGYGVLALYEPTRFRRVVRWIEAGAMIGIGFAIWHGISTL